MSGQVTCSVKHLLRTTSPLPSVSPHRKILEGFSRQHCLKNGVFVTKIVKKLEERYHYGLVVFKELVKTDFQLRYQGSFLGMAWSVLKPLMLFAVMYTVFVRFLKFSDGTPTFTISLLCGTCLWSFFSEATSVGMQSIVGRGDLLRKVHFPNYIIVAATTMGSMISLGINLVVVIIFGFFAHAQYTWHMLLVPLNIIQLYLLALGCALLTSTLYVYFHDVAHIWEELSSIRSIRNTIWKS